MNTLMNEKIMPVIMKFINSKPVLALKDGFVYAMPLMIAGSIFLLLAEFPIKQVTDFFASVGLKEVLNQAYACSFNIMALIAVIGIAYTYADNEGMPHCLPGRLHYQVSCFCSRGISLARRENRYLSF